MGGFFYGRYTKEQVERANQVDLEELLLRSGEKLLPAQARRSGWKVTTASPSEAMSGMTMLPKKVASPSALPESISAFRFRRRWLSCWGKTARRRSPKAKPKPAPRTLRTFRSHPPPEISGGCLTCWGRGRSTARCSQPLYGRGLVMRGPAYHNVVFSGTGRGEVPGTPISGVPTAEGKSFRLNVEEADRPTASTGWEPAGSSMCSKPPIDLLSYITLHPEGLAAAQLCSPLREYPARRCSSG